MKLHNPLPEDLQQSCNKAASILQHFLRGRTALDKKLIPQKIVDQARGIAIVTMVKAGFLWTGRAGTGVVVARLPSGKWSAPVGIAAVGVGFGAQLGAQITDFVFILNNDDAVRAFTHGNVTLGDACNVGGNISVSAGPTGRATEACGALVNFAPIYSYSKSKGVFAGISVEGTVITLRSKANKAAYGKVRAAELLYGSIDPPEFAQPLYRMLDAKFSDLGQKYSQGTLQNSPRDSMAQQMALPGSADLLSSPKSALAAKTSGFQPVSLHSDASLTSEASIRQRPSRPSKPQLQKAVALYDFKKQQHGDLEFKAGDVIWVNNADDASWWNGSLNGIQGDFPSNYVKLA